MRSAKVHNGEDTFHLQNYLYIPTTTLHPFSRPSEHALEFREAWLREVPHSCPARAARGQKTFSDMSAHKLVKEVSDEDVSWTLRCEPGRRGKIDDAAYSTSSMV